ncbi:MAG: HEAT repeat domain-containing protein [Nostocaceae cyanobacterium]|nr:HEAT repeat domain-containing protein [Nostocaceae cyanobacterium]
MNHVDSLLHEAQAAHTAANWSLLTQCLQQLILDYKAKNLEIEEKRQHWLELTLDVLIYGDFYHRWEAAKLLRRLGSICVAPLREILGDDQADEELHWYAVRILGDFKHPEAIAALVEVLKNKYNDELSGVATIALGQIGADAIPSLTELLADDKTKLLSVLALSHIRNSATIEPLLSVVKDEDVSIRAAAVEALSSFHDPRVATVLLNALHDLAATVRREAVNGLGFRPELQSQLDLVNHISPLLYDFNIDVCCTAAVTLSRIGGDVAAKNLYQVLISPHTPQKLQIEVIRGLVWVKTTSGLEYLQQALPHLQKEKIWQEIVSVVGRVESVQLKPKAAEILISLLDTQHPATKLPAIKQALALSLGQLGVQSAIKPLISLLADTHNGVRLHAIAALKNLAPDTAQQYLQQLVDNQTLAPDMQQGVALALAEW